MRFTRWTIRAIAQRRRSTSMARISLAWSGAGTTWRRVEFSAGRVASSTTANSAHGIMTTAIAAPELKRLLDENATPALIDVREHGEYNTAHIPRSSSVPRRLLEWRMARLVPFSGARVVVCDDDGRRAALSASTLERMGYVDVGVLDGGLNR